MIASIFFGRPRESLHDLLHLGRRGRILELVHHDVPQHFALELGGSAASVGESVSMIMATAKPASDRARNMRVPLSHGNGNCSELIVIQFNRGSHG